MKNIGSAAVNLFQLKTIDRGCVKHRSIFQSCLTPMGKWSGCPWCADENEAEEKAAKLRESIERSKILFAEIDKREWKEKMKRCGIPERFANRSFSNFIADSEEKEYVLDFSKKYAEEFESNPGRCAVFIGTPGTGKTHLAVAIGLDLLSREKSVLFSTAIRAIRRIKDTWGKSATETESEAVESLVWPDLLILDEVGVQFGSDAEKILLFDVMNERYERRKSTIILSNLSAEEVKSYLGERVFDRLREDGGKSIVFKWESHRKNMVEIAQLTHHQRRGEEIKELGLEIFGGME